MSLINTELSGTEFNKIHKDKKLYKFLSDDLSHFGFTYKEGLNIDNKSFSPIGNCSSGGLYFCEESTCHLFWKNYGNKIAIIEVPDDARVYVEESKFKADKLIIKEIVKFMDMSYIFWANILLKDYRALEYIKKQTEEICKMALKKNWKALKYVKESFQTEELCKLAIRQNYYAMYFVHPNLLTPELKCFAFNQKIPSIQSIGKDQTDEMCIEAIKFNWREIQHVRNQTKEICLSAIRKNAKALRYINMKYQTEEVCKYATKGRNGVLLKFVKYQTYGICEQAIQQNPFAIQYVNERDVPSFSSENEASLTPSVRVPKNQIEELCKLAVQRNGLALRYVKKQYHTYSICCIAVQQNGKAIQYVRYSSFPENLIEKLHNMAVRQNGLVLDLISEKYKTYDFCKLAVQENGLALRFVKEQFLTASSLLEICKLAVQQNGLALEYVKEQNPSSLLEICKLAVQQNGWALKFIKEENQTEEICILAVQKSHRSFHYARVQTEEMCKLAVQYDGDLLWYVNNQTEEICKLAVQQNGSALQHVHIQFRTKEICDIAEKTRYLTKKRY